MNAHYAKFQKKFDNDFKGITLNNYFCKKVISIQLSVVTEPHKGHATYRLVNVSKCPNVELSKCPDIEISNFGNVELMSRCRERKVENFGPERHRLIAGS